MAFLNNSLTKKRLTQIDVGQSQKNQPYRVAKMLKEHSAKYRRSKSKVGKRWCKVFTSVQPVSNGPLTMHRNDHQPFEFQLK